MGLKEELVEIYFGDFEEGCSDPECEGCQATFDRVLAFVESKVT